MSRANSVVYLGTGLLAVLMTLVPGDPPEDALALRCGGVGAIVVGLCLLLWRARVGRVQHHLLVVLSWALTTSSILFSGGGAPALALSSCFVLVLLDIVAVSSWVVSAAYLVLTATSLVGSLRLVGTGGMDQLAVSVGVLTIMTVFVGLLVRATTSAEIDPLTGVLNQRGLYARMTVAAGRSGRSAQVWSLALVALDHFQLVNEERGHAEGDRLLRAVARTWTSGAPAGAVIARWGDRFAVLAPIGEEELTTVVAALRLGLPDGLTCTAGTAEHEVGESASLVVGRAEAALYLAKRTARGTTAGHSGALAEGRRLLAALAADQIEVHYQPVVALVGGHVTGAEALVRWHHPEHGLVPPGSFIHQAELSGVIVELGRHIVREACRQAATWAALPDGTPRRVNVNATGRELAEDDYASFVLATLREYSLPPAALVIEITEGVLDTDSLTVMANLTDLRMAGVRLALDDFGTGHSSLARLAQLDVAVLKIDRSFIAPIVAASDTAPLVSAILGLARAMDLDVVAEGIETPEQAAWLRAAGCAKVQGFLYSKALPGEQFHTWLAAHEQLAAQPAGAPGH